MQKIVGDRVFEGHSLVNPASGDFVSNISDVDIYSGNVRGARSFSISGTKSDVSTVTYERLEITPSVLPSIAGVAMTIRSTSAADVGNQILVSQLGPGGTYLDPVVYTLTGITPVPLPNGSRINSMWRNSGDLVGNCIVESGGQVISAIMAGGQRDLQSRYCVPAGHRLHLESINAGISKPQGSSAGAVVRLTGKPAASNVYGLLFAFSLNRDGSSSHSPRQGYPSGVLGPFDLQFEGLATAAALDVFSFASGVVFDLSQFNKP